MLACTFNDLFAVIVEARIVQMQMAVYEGGHGRNLRGLAEWFPWRVARHVKTK